MSPENRLAESLRVVATEDNQVGSGRVRPGQDPVSELGGLHRLNLAGVCFALGAAAMRDGNQEGSR
jgi:hypothetical protein